MTDGSKKNKATLLVKADEVKVKLVSNNLKVGFCTVTCEPELSLLGGATMDVQMAVKLASEIRTNVYSHECNTLNVTTMAYPFRGLRAVITILTGTVLVIAVPHEQLQGADFSTYVANAQSGALMNNPSTILEQDSSVYIPFGHVPILLPFITETNDGPQPMKAAGSKKNLAMSSTEFSSYAVSIYLSSTFDLKCGNPAMSFGVSQMVAAQARLPNSFRTNKPVQEWKAALEAALAKDAAVPG